MESNLYDAITKCMCDCGVSQTDIANASGVRVQIISFLTTRRRMHVRSDNYIKLMDAIKSIYKEKGIAQE